MLQTRQIQASVLTWLTLASSLAITTSGQTDEKRFEEGCFFDGFSENPTGFLDIALADTGSMTLQLDQIVHEFTMDENCTLIFRSPVPGRILPADAPKLCEIVDSEKHPHLVLHTLTEYNRTKFPELFRGTFRDDGDPVLEVRTVWTSTQEPVKLHCHVSNYTSAQLDTPVGAVDFTFRITVKACPEGRYGKNCRETCLCQNGASCHSFNGACYCAPGWTGLYCDEVISEAGIVSTKGLVEPTYVSENVTMTCMGYNLNDVTNITWYKNGSEVVDSEETNVTLSSTEEGLLQSTIVLPYVMDEGHGAYDCIVIVETALKETKYNASRTINVKGCPDGMWGSRCEKTCACPAKSTCYRDLGCVCWAGLTGTECNQQCDELPDWKTSPMWGEDCQFNCTCENMGLCGIHLGNCSCPDGYMGDNCEDACPDGTFGKNCTGNCTCADGEFCSPINGDCVKETSVIDEPWFPPVMSFAGVFVFLAAIAAYLTVKVRRRNAAKYLRLEGEDEETLEVVKRIVQEENSSSIHQVTVEEILTWELPREELKTVRMLGQGAFGDVLQARWTRGAMQEEGNGITVAAKKMKDSSSTKAVRDFLKEAYHLINIGHHRNIVNIHGICLQEGPLMLVLEYCEHGCVLDYLWELEKRGRMETIMDPTKALVSAEEGQRLTGYAVDVCNGLKHLASKRYVHRDIAARNVVIHGKGMAKICDFGLTRDVYTEIYTKQGLKDAALPYKWMAIESMEGDGECTHKSDMWSFGVFLWELGTLGKTPYRGMDNALLVEELHTGYRLPKPKGCPQPLYDLMFSCWQEDPDARPEALEIWLNLVDIKNAKTGFFSYECQSPAIDYVPDVADAPDAPNTPAIADVPAVAEVRPGRGPVSRLVPSTGNAPVDVGRVMDVSEV
ncbi:RET [Branchiostoma lanceolatum]|uniref:receptor protein-tyrosine kinase n=1 Tax=Branchiostoma lanceolatum TaxID=7740 RepID=A0A8J9YY38_BRALA|nr:RET [Branchiostoma lanceolatum]